MALENVETAAACELSALSDTYKHTYHFYRRIMNESESTSQDLLGISNSLLVWIKKIMFL